MEKNKKEQKFKPLDIAYIGIFSALIALFSWVSIPTTVPFTLQTLAIFLTLTLLGGRNGFYSILVYIALGAAGVPVFSGFKGGLGVLAGNTGGYILGFILLGALYWVLTSLFGEKLHIQITALVLGLILCYAFGTAWFMYLYIKANGAVTLITVLGWCVFPFILPDAIKMAAAILLAKRLKKYIK